MILQELERLQDQFWDFAHGKERPAARSLVACELTRQDPAPSKSMVIAPPTNAQTSSTVQKEVRTYRRTKKPCGPRTWRTRTDPFAEVSGQIQRPLQIDPSRTGQELFIDLPPRYPRQFP